MPESPKRIYRKICVNYGYEPVNVFVHRGEPYAELTHEDLQYLLNEWSRDQETSAPLTGWAVSPVEFPSGDVRTCYTVFDNSDHELWMEDFFDKKLALKWLTGNYDAFILLERDEMLQEYCKQTQI